LARGAASDGYRTSGAFGLAQRVSGFMEKIILVLASGRGTDFQAIVDHARLGIFNGVKIGALICNHESAPVVGRAEEAGVKTIVIRGTSGEEFQDHSEREIVRSRFDQECLQVAKEMGASLVVLAGFDQILGRKLLTLLRSRY